MSPYLERSTFTTQEVITILINKLCTRKINDGDFGISGIPSLIRIAIINSGPGISRPREGIGVALSHALVSLVAGDEPGYGCQNDVKDAQNGENPAHDRI